MANNDIMTQSGLRSALGGSLEGYEHNDIVTRDVMDAAISEGGGGGSSDFTTCTLTIRQTTFDGYDSAGSLVILTPVLYNGTLGPVYVPRSSLTLPLVVEIPLYDGRTRVSVQDFVSRETEVAYDDESYDMSGGISYTYDEEADLGYFDITGGCSVGVGISGGSI